jgi:hypothetical protein
MWVLQVVFDDSLLSLVFVAIFPFSFLILLIPPHFCQICQGLINPVYFSENRLFVLMILVCFFLSLSLILAIIFIISLLPGTFLISSLISSMTH